MPYYRKPEAKMISELPSGKKAGTKVVKKRPPTMPHTKPKRRTLITMAPDALRLFAYRFYRLGFNDTGSGFHGEMLKNEKLTQKNLQALIGLLNVRFNRAYQDKEEP